MFTAARDGKGKQAPFASLLRLIEGKQDVSLAPWDLPNLLVAPLGSVLPWSQPQPVLGVRWLLLSADVFGCFSSFKPTPKPVLVPSESCFLACKLNREKQKVMLKPAG